MRWRHVTLFFFFLFFFQAPDSAGPEGVFGDLDGLLPCHYYIQSLRSETEYCITTHQGGTAATADRPRQKLADRCGTGLAHLETNYGAAFPDSWIWVQAVSPTASIMVTGGRFIVAGVVTHTYLIGYRDNFRSWDYRTTELDKVNVTFDSCADPATVHLTATPRPGAGT